MSAIVTIPSSRLTISNGPTPQSVVVSIQGALSIDAAVSLRDLLDRILNGRDIRDSLTISIGLDEVPGPDLDRGTGLEAATKWAERHSARVWYPDPRSSAGDRRDQAGEERDQAGEERDQAGDRRDQAGEERDQAAERRDQAGDRRDQAGDRRDQAAGRRDQAAGLRDQAAEQSETRGSDEIAADALYRATMARRDAASDRRQASQDRQAGASERDRAELDRDTAWADRGSAAGERTRAELDRDTALADRGASARDREYASHDDLTGAYLRGPGVVELEREIVRAKRTGQPLVVAFVDVDYLKTINDSRGHAAGDRMLVEVVDAFRVNLRSYDLIIRYGGDEFICAMSGQTMIDATARLPLVKTALEKAPEHGSVTVGLAELLPDDTLETLVARADVALYRQRQHNRYPSSS